jgi:hypothetical protein
VEHDPRGFFPPGELRVSDAERDLAVSELSRAFQAGRLTAEEFNDRSEQAFAARTGNDLVALLADLPVEEAPPAAAAAVAPRDDFAPARPRVLAGATIAAVCFALVAVANAFSHGPTLQEREQVQQIFRAHGVSIPLPPASGFNWPGTITPAIISLLFIALIIVIQTTRSRRA